ncbi:MAG: metallophosphoesterase family protein [Candidatus Aenigmarchaeota archaeon]|nr:metallophosphoesterase family protein [Candidatus Aenigmarchaeota archaeon]
MKYAIFADVHANYAALKAVFEHININYGPAINYYLFGGDAVGQGPHPNEVCTLLRGKRNLIGIKGDNDVALLKNLTTGLDKDIVDTIAWTSQILTKENRRFLDKLEEYVGIHSDGLEILLVHGSPDNLISGEIYQNIIAEDAKRIFDKTGADILLTCHTHTPFVRQFDARLLINVGSVGQPRDRDPRACYVFLDTETRQVTFHRVAYNITLTAESARRAKLPESFSERLYYGW